MYSIEAPFYMATVTRTFLCENEKLCKFILSHSFSCLSNNLFLFTERTSCDQYNIANYVDTF